MKNFLASKTIKAALVGILAGVLSIIAHFTGWEADTAPLALELVTIVTSMAAAYFRTQADKRPVPLFKGPPAPPAPPAAAKGTLILALLLMLGVGGCAALQPQVNCQTAAEFEVNPAATAAQPAWVKISCVGEPMKPATMFTAPSDLLFPVSCNPGSKGAVTNGRLQCVPCPEGEVTCG